MATNPKQSASFAAVPLAGKVGILFAILGLISALYFFAMYVLGASFGSTVMGAMSDFFAQRAMLAAGATEMLAPFRAAGLRSAMHAIPVLMLLCAVSLLLAARTVAADMQRLQAKLNSPRIAAT